MRFLNAFLGTFGALVISSLVLSVVAGLDGGFVVITVFSAVAACIGAGVIMLLEKSTWSWGKYAVAGVLTTGLVQFAAALGFISLLVSAFGGRANEIISHPLAFLPIALVFAISGAMSGIGYRYLGGVKPAA